MFQPLLLVLVLVQLSAGSHVADTLARTRAAMPASPVSEDTLSRLAKAKADGHTRILVAGDSWGTVTAVGSALGLSFFERTLEKHSCNATSVSIAVPGTETTDWDSGLYLDALKLAAKEAEFIWIVLMGNDALDRMPDCASSGKSAKECGDELYALASKNMGKILDEVHEANPSAQVVGFGYDTMFGGLGCELVTAELFPQCYKAGGGGNRCFNTEFLKIQAIWEDVAANRSWVDATSILGATQVKGGDAAASTGEPPDFKGRHIDMDKMGPAKYWPDYEACFHPGVFGGEDSGAMVVMEEFHRAYWAKQLGCPSSE
jgi:hypothetical protein